MARDLPHDESQHEDNLLVEAVSLLVQRQRETEAWVAEQIDQAEQRAGSVERQYAELDLRLAALEEQIERFGRELGSSGGGDGAGGHRLARLREQVAELRAEPVDGRQLRPLPPSPPVAKLTEPAPEPPAGSVSVVQPPATGGMWALLGPTGRERFGLLAMFLGLVALLYAVLSQLRF